MKRFEIIVALSSAHTLPWETIEECLANPQDTVPLFLLLLEREARGLAIDENERSALFYGLHLLAALGVSDTFSPLLTFLQKDSQTIARLTGDAIAVTLPRILMSTAHDQNDACWQMVMDQKCDWIVRDAFLKCWTFEVLEGHVSTLRASQLLEQFAKLSPPPPDDYMWAGWLTAIADLGLSDLMPMAEQARSSGLIKNGPTGISEADMRVFQQDFEVANTARKTVEGRLSWMKDRGYMPFTGTQEDFQTAHQYRPFTMIGDPLQGVGSDILRAAEDSRSYDDD